MGEEGPSIDPRELVGQSGPDKGRIIDIALAQTGAEAENDFRNRNSSYGRGLPNQGFGTEYSGDPDTAGELAMADEVGFRAMENPGGMEILFPEDVDWVALEATKRFKKEIWEKSPRNGSREAGNGQQEE